MSFAAAPILAFAAGACVCAQELNGVPNADVNAGYAALSSRAAYAPASDGRQGAVAEQISYQHNLGERWSLSGGAVFTDRGPGNFQFRAFQAIAQYQFAESEAHGVDGALLVIARIPDQGDGPGRLALLAAGKWIRRDWEIRGLLAVNVEYGDGAKSGLGLGTRIEATRRIGSIGRLGAQLGDSFNTTAHFGAFRDQNHQAGPMFKTVLGRSLTVSAASLFGISKAAPDAEFKLFLTYEL